MIACQTRRRPSPNAPNKSGASTMPPPMPRVPATAPPHSATVKAMASWRAVHVAAAGPCLGLGAATFTLTLPSAGPDPAAAAAGLLLSMLPRRIGCLLSNSRCRPAAAPAPARRANSSARDSAAAAWKA